MHEAGRRLKVERILPDGTRACLSDVTHYDFDAQGLYLFDEPLVVDHEDDVEITCTWDTRRFDQPVRYGGGLDDEMCMAIVFATIGTPDAPESATP